MTPLVEPPLLVDVVNLVVPASAPLPTITVKGVLLFMTCQFCNSGAALPSYNIVGGEAHALAAATKKISDVDRRLNRVVCIRGLG
ncbi:MAG: hypothetical protein KAY02_08060 [Acidovorax sp.]|nr:hypothetical protein [Acidovorax sp.]